MWLTVTYIKNVWALAWRVIDWNGKCPQTSDAADWTPNHSENGDETTGT